MPSFWIHFALLLPEITSLSFWGTVARKNQAKTKQKLLRKAYLQSGFLSSPVAKRPPAVIRASLYWVPAMPQGRCVNSSRSPPREALSPCDRWRCGFQGHLFKHLGSAISSKSQDLICICLTPKPVFPFGFMFSPITCCLLWEMVLPRLGQTQPLPPETACLVFFFSSTKLTRHPVDRKQRYCPKWDVWSA